MRKRFLKMQNQLSSGWLGNDIHLGNSLLIEDGCTEPTKFRELGGYSYQYSTDALFVEWLRWNTWIGDKEI